MRNKDLHILPNIPDAYAWRFPGKLSASDCCLMAEEATMRRRQNIQWSIRPPIGVDSVLLLAREEAAHVRDQGMTLLLPMTCFTTECQGEDPNQSHYVPLAQVYITDKRLPLAESAVRIVQARVAFWPPPKNYTQCQPSAGDTNHIDLQERHTRYASMAHVFDTIPQMEQREAY